MPHKAGSNVNVKGVGVKSGDNAAFDHHSKSSRTKQQEKTDEGVVPSQQICATFDNRQTEFHSRQPQPKEFGLGNEQMRIKTRQQQQRPDQYNLHQPVSSSQYHSPLLLKCGDWLICSGNGLGRDGGDDLIGQLIFSTVHMLVLRESEKPEAMVHWVNRRSIFEIKKLHKQTSSTDQTEQDRNFTISQMLPFGNASEAKRRLARAIAAKADQLVPSEVSFDARSLFIDLRKMFPDVVWSESEKGIIVLKCVLVKSPFDDSDASLRMLVRSEASHRTLERIQKILRKRFQLPKQAQKDDGGNAITTGGIQQQEHQQQHRPKQEEGQKPRSSHFSTSLSTQNLAADVATVKPPARRSSHAYVSHSSDQHQVYHRQQQQHQQQQTQHHQAKEGSKNFQRLQNQFKFGTMERQQNRGGVAGQNVTFVRGGLSSSSTCGGKNSTATAAEQRPPTTFMRQDIVEQQHGAAAVGGGMFPRVTKNAQHSYVPSPPLPSQSATYAARVATSGPVRPRVVLPPTPGPIPADADEFYSPTDDGSRMFHVAPPLNAIKVRKFSEARGTADSRTGAEWIGNTRTTNSSGQSQSPTDDEQFHSPVGSLPPPMSRPPVATGTTTTIGMHAAPPRGYIQSQMNNTHQQQAYGGGPFRHRSSPTTMFNPSGNRNKKKGG